MNKIDFAILFTTTRANPNGDPNSGNLPRTDFANYGEISDVCIKRKIRNRMQDMGQKIFVQSDDRIDDGCDCLSKRADALKKIKTEAEYQRKACETWLDVRTFGQVFAFDKKADSISTGIRGPLTIGWGRSIDPITVRENGITKSTSGKRKEDGGKGSDTMGSKSFVDFGLYKVTGSINARLAEKTGFSADDTAIVKECLATLFMNDESSARPAGSMEIVNVYWWEHNNTDGQYSSATVHRSLKVALKPEVDIPQSIDDYEITLEELPNLSCEVVVRT